MAHSSKDRPAPAVAARVALVYAAFAALWILASDAALGWLLRDPQMVALISTFKGWIFVVVTASLLYVLIRRLGERTDAPAVRARRPLLAMIVSSLLILSLAAAALAYVHRQYGGQAAGALQAAAGKRAAELSAWLAHVASLTGRVADSVPIQRLAAEWDAAPDAAAGRELEAWLGTLAALGGADAAAIVSDRGRTVSSSGAPRLADDRALLATAGQAIASGRVLLADPHPRGTAPSPSIFAVAPVQASDAPGRDALVFRFAPPRPLLASAAREPGEGHATRIRLLRREGTDLLDLASGRLVDSTAGGSPVASVIRGESAPGTPVEGLGPDDRPVLGVVARLGDTEWYLEASLQRSELAAASRTAAGWIALAAAFAIGLTWMVMRLVQERQALRLAEVEQRAQQERLRVLHLLGAIADASTDAIFAKDREGRYMMFNPAAERVTGMAAGQVIGKDDRALFPAAEAEALLAADREIMDAGRTVTREETLTTSAGQATFLATKGPLRDARGRVSGLFGISRDITARKRAEEQLQMLSQAVEQSPQGVLIADGEGVVCYANATFCRRIGSEREGVTGHRLHDLQAGYGHSVFAALADKLAGAEVWRGELISQGRGSELLHESAVIAPIRLDGAISHHVAMLEDIAERKRMADELDRHRHRLEDLVAIRTAELEEARLRAEGANRAKSAFLANMSHEIRTPMNAIVGLTHLLQRDVADPAMRGRLGKIAGAAHHLLRVIDDILDLSKIEAGRLELEDGDFALAELLEQVRSMVSEAAERKGIEFQIVAQGVPESLRGDVTRLRQALLNYVNNAIKFTERGSVTVRVSLMSEQDGELLLRFEVADTGVGIEAKGRSRLFQAFEQADVSTTRRQGGTGLGLAITRRLAELMGGEAGVSSRPGEGSRFWFTARLWRSEAGVEAKRPAASVLAHGSRVLVAEDNAVNREVLAELLKHLGLQVHAVSDGEQALACCRAQSFDLVLMDVQMPVLDGLAACRAIRRLDLGANLPIVALTANAFEEDRRACRAAGMNDFLTKPVDPSLLESVLLRWLPTAEPARAEAADDEAMQIAPAGDVASGAEEQSFRAALKAMLERGDIDCARHLAGNASLARQALGGLAGAIRDCVGVFDYERALEMLESLQAGAPGQR